MSREVHLERLEVTLYPGLPKVEGKGQKVSTGLTLGRRLFSIVEEATEIIEGLKMRQLPASGKRASAIASELADSVRAA